MLIYLCLSGNLQYTQQPSIQLFLHDSTKVQSCFLIETRYLVHIRYFVFFLTLKKNYLFVSVFSLRT